MARAKLRRLVADERVFLYRMDWHYDRDGTRIVEVAIYPADPEREGRPRGHWLRAHFVAREPGVSDTAVALPADVRAVLDRGQALGWDGTRDRWLLPTCGLERPDLVMTAPTRLCAWVGDATLYELCLAEPALAGTLARELGAPLVAEARGGAEAQWRDEHSFVLHPRDGHLAHVYLRSFDDLVGVLDLVTRRAPQVGLSVRVLPTQHAEAPPPGPPAPDHWSTQPAARRHRGWRERDVIWTFIGPEGPQLEALEFHADAPDRPWRWLSVRADAAIERRYPRPPA